MRVLLVGASGFIGRRLGVAIQRDGHEVVAVTRGREALPAQVATRQMRGDFSVDVRPDDWLPRLAGIDVAINAAGILRERRGQKFDRLHEAGPQALFTACALAGVRRVIQVSALGADEHADSPYHLTKKATDDMLLALPIASTVVQPSLVYGASGRSAALFNLLASLPWVPLPGQGDQRVQPVHVDDLVEAVSSLVDSQHAAGRRVEIVGPEALSLRHFLTQLRHALGLPPARFIEMPMPLVRAAATVGRLVPGALLDQDTLQMLLRGNTASAEPTRSLLGRPPRPVAEFIPPDTQAGARTQALLSWLLPPLRWSIACVWIVTGLLSFGLYPVEESRLLLARLGITGTAATMSLYGAASLDLAMGIATLCWRRRTGLWRAQLALIGGYTALITWWLPEHWLHPFGPILKNLPLMAAIALLLALEEDH